MENQIQEQIADDLAKEIQQEIDAEIMSDMMAAIGWTVVKRSFRQRHISISEGAELRLWLSENATGEYRMLGSTYIVFENAKDATWFQLRWS